MEEFATLPGFGGVGKVVAALSHWLNGICVTSRVSLPRRYTLGNERGQFYLLDKMDCMAPTGRTRAHGLAGEPRLVGWLYQSPNILSHVNSILHVDPGDGGAPLGPLEHRRHLDRRAEWSLRVIKCWGIDKANRLSVVHLPGHARVCGRSAPCNPFCPASRTDLVHFRECSGVAKTLCS